MKDPYTHGILVNLSMDEVLLVPKFRPIKAEKFTTHRVQEGETLFDISHRYFGETGFWTDIAEYNALEDPVILEEGLIINIPILDARD